ncbi:TetR family transcriptional regulator [Paenibacillus yonginensis]|uniref:TetR family transcriptional regulator n=1 Tax=Paenibacillus yonginensis TaxID=1462996 RepID=A0A1B1N4A8_9BACL|nr:TetR/AcrR family transcriptional regulator [Paenibacillus yonginensis]ANS76215.1 TetR family transcriptional regulator [Paenibacillus yonginensis]
MARSKEFEEKVVLDKAMKLFWEQGYEKTSMSDLVEHMGIHRRSLYDTFTDKHTLFLKAFDRFAERTNSRLAAGVKESATAEDAMKFLFKYMIFGDEDTPPGCMLVNSAAELAVRDMEVDVKTRAGFSDTERLIKEIVVWGQEKGEFTTAIEADDLAQVLHNSLVGLRVLTRTSTPKEKLERIAELSMYILKKK